MSSTSLPVAALCALLASGLAFAQGGSLGDPTRPTALNEAPPVRRAGPAEPRWTLHSTLVAPGRQLAVINGRPVRVGDVVEGATVVDIRRDGVTLDNKQGRMELPLHPQTQPIRKGIN